MATTEQLMAQADQYIMKTYNRFPVVLVKGSGTRVWDNDGREYLDFVAGIATCSLGHAHPAVVAAIRDQAQTLGHCSNLYYIEPQIRFARLLVEHSFADKVFFCNSGAEANEGAIKLARKYGHDQMGGRYGIITMRDSFHGRTLATVTATGQEKYQVGFAPLPAGFTYVPFNDVKALAAAVTEETCGVMVEPIQAEGGVRVPAETYLQEIRALCDERGLLLILDEVQTGIGRTGYLFAHEPSGVKPDIMTLAKALGNGFPVGALLATDRVASAFGAGNHASTFGGNPLAMAACIASWETLLREDCIGNCREMGRYFLDALQALASRQPAIREIRGKGLLIGVELDREAAPIVNAFLQKGILIASAGPRVLRFVPPLIVQKDEIDRVVHTLGEILEGP